MQPIAPPKTLKIFQLLRQNGISFSVSTSNTSTLGTGFFPTLQEAEHHRTLEVLKETGTKTQFHIFELEIPNPAYQESKE